MVRETGTTYKTKLDRPGLEKQGVFIFDGLQIGGENIPTICQDGEEFILSPAQVGTWSNFVAKFATMATGCGSCCWFAMACYPHMRWTS